MQNWVNSFPEVILLVLMLTQFIVLWLIMMAGNKGENNAQQVQ
ncbi:hypothetical protein HG1285_10140 [Hydrogenivirga sp. 128-5-R1-1]|nr:hypothetical protein HG1285_10140 [Hydrogenivirga sp. 128-5-R1-1]